MYPPHIVETIVHIKKLYWINQDKDINSINKILIILIESIYANGWDHVALNPNAIRDYCVETKRHSAEVYL